jgi:hypothetical protein
MTNDAPNNKNNNNTDNNDIMSSALSSSARHFAAITVFDEIDAHVGGRAAIAIAHMLAEQSSHDQIYPTPKSWPLRTTRAWRPLPMPIMWSANRNR